MKIEKAIEILQSHIEWCDSVKEVDTFDALQLGIEALKRFKRIQEDYPFAHTWQLPGETKD